MKVVFDFNLNAWIKGVEVEATSYDEALSKLHSLTFDEILETGFSKDFNIDDIDGLIVERTIKVKVYDIDYDVEEDDFENPGEYTEFINKLPDTLTLTVVAEPNDDLEDLIADEITYKTDQTVNSFKFITLEEN
jgi:hypothetical protein